MVLFREQNGRWATVAELLPDAAMIGDEEMSLAVVGGTPLVSIKTDPNKIRTMQFANDHEWVDVSWPESAKPISNFQTINDGYKTHPLVDHRQ